MSFEIFVMNFMVNETINIQRACMHICMDMENRIGDINLGLGIYIRVSVKIKNTSKHSALHVSFIFFFNLQIWVMV